MAKLSRDEYKTVLAFFEKTLAEEPEKLLYWYDIGFCRGRLGIWGGAAEALEKAAKNQTKNPAIFNLLGHAYIKLKRYDEAVDVLKKALRLRPNSPRLIYKLAAAYFGKGRLKTAKSTLRKMLKLTPGFGKAHFGIGLVCYYLEDTRGYNKQIAILDNLSPELSEKLSSLAEA